MHSIRTKITVITVAFLVVAMGIAAALGVTAIRNIGNRNADQVLQLLCEKGQKDLNSYFLNVEKSVEIVSAYVESDLTGLEDEDLRTHLESVSDIFFKLTQNTSGILTYYYRIDPDVSENVKGFWYVDADGRGF